MKPKKEIPRYKLDTCLTCGLERVPTVAQRCIGSPYCYEKHRKAVRDARNAERGKTAENKPVYTIPKQSPKRKKLDAIYNIAAAQFKKDKPVCELKLSGCTYHTTDVHHLYSGASKIKYYLDTKEWKAACANCHYIVHNVLSMDEAIALGLKKTEV